MELGFDPSAGDFRVVGYIIRRCVCSSQIDLASDGREPCDENKLACEK